MPHPVFACEEVRRVAMLAGDADALGLLFSEDTKDSLPVI
jgi:hypothetical protein